MVLSDLRLQPDKLRRCRRAFSVLLDRHASQVCHSRLSLLRTQYPMTSVNGRLDAGKLFIGGHGLVDIAGNDILRKIIQFVEVFLSRRQQFPVRCSLSSATFDGRQSHHPELLVTRSFSKSFARADLHAKSGRGSCSSG